MASERDLFAADAAKDDMLVLVDGLDRQVGVATKEQAHREGLLHRAFSVVLVRGDGAILLSRRAEGKYHSAGLWANSCCSHPRAGEPLVAAAARRVAEELSCEAPELEEIGAFVYRAPFTNGLVEYEYDHVLLGRFGVGEGEGEGAAAPQIAPDPAEVAEVRWVAPDELAAELAAHPERFAAWAPTVLSLALQVL